MLSKHMGEAIGAAFGISLKRLFIPLMLLFVGLKLAGYINWSWLWVLAPLWLPFAAIVVLVAAVATAELASALAARAGWRGRS